VLTGDEPKGVLPKNINSREQTPLTEAVGNAVSDVPSEVKFFSGNPFVEQTNGIIHLYKKK
jgi:hypothetical protein